MKKLFIGLMIVALCTQPVFAMETGQKTHKKKSTTSNCANISAKILCVLLVSSTVSYGIIQTSEYFRLQQEWNQMQKECWDPCLPNPGSGPRPWPELSEYQEIKWEDHWLPRVWDTRLEQYRDELNCPDQTQDAQLKIQGCKRLEKREPSDQAALACIAGMEANDQDITPAIIPQKEELIRRAAHRQECQKWPQYLAWKQTHRLMHGNGYPCQHWDSPYLSALYQDNQPQVVDLRKCRFLRPSDCRFSSSTVGIIVDAFSKKKQCEKLSYPEKKDGDEVSDETITNLVKLARSCSSEDACTIWDQELEKKHQ